MLSFFSLPENDAPILVLVEHAVSFRGIPRIGDRVRPRAKHRLRSALFVGPGFSDRRQFLRQALPAIRFERAHLSEVGNLASRETLGRHLETGRERRRVGDEPRRESHDAIAIDRNPPPQVRLTERLLNVGVGPVFEPRVLGKHFLIDEHRARLVVACVCCNIWHGTHSTWLMTHFL